MKCWGPAPLALAYKLTKLVEFIDHSETKIGNPDPNFLAIHNSLAHVLHLSGAGAAIKASLENGGLVVGDDVPGSFPLSSTRTSHQSDAEIDEGIEN